MKIHIFLFSLACLCISFGFSDPGHSSTGINKTKTEQIALSFYRDEMPSYFLIVDKSKQQLHLFEQYQTVRLLKTFACATGENPGTKTISGDSKTPVGLYFITEVYEDNKITIYGSRAFHLDYPNVFDRHAGHQGNGIFIHGTNKRLIPYSTNGCITLANPDLDELADYLSIGDLPVIVLEEFTTPLFDGQLKISKDDQRFREILRKLAIQPGDSAAQNIESLSFLRLGREAIASISYRAFSDTSLKYRFRKRAYLTLNGSRNWHTLYAVESQDIIPTILAMQPVKHQIPELAMQVEIAPPVEPVKQVPALTRRVPVNSAANLASPTAMKTVPPTPQVVAASSKVSGDTTGRKPVAAQVAPGEELLAFVDKWKVAWSSKDINTYMDCYSPTFKSGKFNRKSWRKKKSYLNKKYDYIHVVIRDIAIEWTESGANVSFFQVYESDQYQTSGTKRLQLVNMDNKWMIQREVM